MDNGYTGMPADHPDAHLWFTRRITVVAADTRCRHGPYRTSDWLDMQLRLQQQLPVLDSLWRLRQRSFGYS